ncbi:MAG: PKD domain-containing protein [Thermoplasmata archaeon]
MKKSTALTVLIVLLLVTSPVILILMEKNKTLIQNHSTKTLQDYGLAYWLKDFCRYTSRAPVRINNDADFIAANGVVSGNGTPGNPYIIEGWDINGNSYGYCHYIGNTSKHFVIRNCYLHGASGNSNQYYWNTSIILYNCSNGTVINSTAIYNAGHGVILYYSRNCTISNINGSNNIRGIYLNNSCNNTIVANYLSDNTEYGIAIYSFSNYNTISANNATRNSYYGIFLFNSSSNNNITINNASNNSRYGIVLSLYCGNNTIIGNNARGNSWGGIFISTSSNNNTILSNNASYNSDYGIFISTSSNYNIVSNNNASGNYHGIRVYSSDNNTITYNHVFNNSNYGINITAGSINNLLHHNNLISNNNGGCQAYDSVSGNKWYLSSPQEGNYWSNWNGQNWGTASAYPLAGGAGASDWYPLFSQVQINRPPVANFTADITNGTAPLAVSFTSTSYDPDGIIVSYFWNFGDGNSSTLQKPNHTFTTPGNYTVKLTVIDNNGANSTANLTVRVLALPLASFTTNTTTGAAPLAVRFTSNSTDPDGSIVSYQWYFGDGNTSTVQNPTHTYLTPGNYPVSLTVEDQSGLNASTSMVIEVRPKAENKAPVAQILSIKPNPAKQNSTIVFNGSSYDPDGFIVEYRWNSSIDGIVSRYENFGVDNLSAGIHNISFSVKDNNGSWSVPVYTQLTVEELEVSISSSRNYCWWLGILLLLVIILSLLILYLYFRRYKSKEEKTIIETGSVGKEAELCSICEKGIEEKEEFRCECGGIYHKKCIDDLSYCPFCGKKVRGRDEYVKVHKPIKDIPIYTGTLDVKSSSKEADKATICNICLGVVKPGSEMLKCKCGMVFHPPCAKRTGVCPSCNVRIVENAVNQSGPAGSSVSIQRSPVSGVIPAEKKICPVCTLEAVFNLKECRCGTVYHKDCMERVDKCLSCGVKFEKAETTSLPVSVPDTSAEADAEPAGLNEGKSKKIPEEPEEAAEKKSSKEGIVVLEHRVVKSEKQVKCLVCMGYIKPGLEFVHCVCGKNYHIVCARRVDECLACNRTFVEGVKR